MPKRSIFFFILAVSVNLIIAAPKVQAQTNAQTGNKTIEPQELFSDEVNYRLDEATIVRGYPASSRDSICTLFIPPLMFREPVVVSISIFHSPKAAYAYRFQITQNGKIMLLTRALTIACKTPVSARLYYYHQQQNQWLALFSKNDSDRGWIISPKVDFAEGIIGVFYDSSLPNTFDAAEELKNASLIEPLSEETDSISQDSFTVNLNNDILEKGYTIFAGDAKIAVDPGVLNTPSAVSARWNKAEKTLDYNFSPIDPAKKPLQEGALLTITIPFDNSDYSDKNLAFWDNNFQNWRELSSVYRVAQNTVSAKTPFSFGKYKLVRREGAYRGQASWFRDSLITKNQYSAASNDYPYGTKVRVFNSATNKFVDVTVLSTGPFVSGRIIDLSRSAFSSIASPGAGVIAVKVEKL